MSFFQKANILKKENNFSESIKYYRKSITHDSETYWNYINMADLLGENNFVEQEVASNIIAFRNTKKDYLFKRIEKYIPDPKKYISYLITIESKYDLNKYIIEALWGGYSFYSLVWLEIIALDINSNDELRYEAAWNAGRWYHYKKEYSKSIDKVNFIKEQFNNKYENRKELVLLSVYSYLGMKEESKAKDELLSYLDIYPFDEDCLLVLSSIEVNEEYKLELINKIYLSNNLSEIKKDNKLKPLSLNNIKSVALSTKSKQLVSVIIPAYNASKTIETAVNSLINQSWENLEIIVIDDCSTDNTYNIIKRIEERDSRVKVKRQEKNSGAYAARNIGLHIANGIFVTTHDADDWSHPEKISKQIEFLNKNPKLIGVCTHWVRTSEKLNFIYNWRVGKELVHWSHSSFIFRKEILNEIGLWDEVRVGADTEFIWRIQAKYGNNSISKIYSNIPFSFALDDIKTLTRTNKTHIQSMYFGLRQIYRESAKKWHENHPEKIYLNNNVRPFDVPCGIIDKEGFTQNLDMLYVADFNDPLAIKKIKMSIVNCSNAGLSIGLLHWPIFSKDRTFNDEYFKIISLENVRPIVAGYIVNTKNVVFLDKNHSLYIPDYFPEINALNATYIIFFNLINKEKIEIEKLFFKIFNVREKNIEFFKIQQLKTINNTKELFLGENEIEKPNHNNIEIEEMYNLLSSCKLTSLNHFDEKSVSYIFKNTNISELNYNIANLTYALLSVNCKNHENSKVARSILLHLSKNDSFLLFKYITDISEDIIPFLTKLYFLLLLKKKPEENFMQMIALKMSRLKKNDLSLLLDINSLFDLVNRGIFKKNNFSLSIENSKILHLNSKRVIQTILKKKSKITNKTNISKVTFVLARPFLGDVVSNSHFIVLESYAKLINNYNKEIGTKNKKIVKSVLITGEKVFNLPLGDWSPIDDATIKNNVSYMVERDIIESEDLLYIYNTKDTFNKNVTLEKSFEWLKNENPDVTVFLGGTYDSKVFRYKTYYEYPIAFLPTTSSVDNVYGEPDFYYHSTKAATPEHAIELLKFGIEEKNILFFPKPFFIDRDKNLDSFQWKSYGLNNRPEGSLCLTPLTGNRINSWIISLTDNEINLLLSLFDKIESLKWIFVGQSLNSFKKAVSRDARFSKLIEEGRIIIIEYTLELNELIKEINLIYLPSNGGATTIANAIYYNIPCVIPEESDASTLIHKKILFKDYPDSFEIVKNVISNKELREECIFESKELFKVRTNINSISSEFVKLLYKSLK